jgi:gas vesicle protein
VPTDLLPEGLRLQKEEPGFFDVVQSYTTDIPVRAIKGALGGVESATNIFGPDNAVSEMLEGAQEGINEYLVSDTAKQEALKRSKRLEGKGFLGTLAEVPGILKDDPALLFEVLGSAAPAIAATALTGPVGGVVVGGAMGIGTTKESIFDATKDEYIKAGASKKDAIIAAREAQSYVGKNLDMIALGGALSALASRTGLEPTAARMLAGRVLGKSVSQSAGREAIEGALKSAAEKGAIRTGLTEAGTEGAQGAQGVMAGNLARSREGFDVDVMEGVGQAAALEGTLGGIAGAGVGLVGRPSAAARAAEAEAETESRAPADEREDIFAFRKGVTSRLAEAAGPDLSPEATAAIDSVGLKISSDVAQGTSESLDSAEAYIRKLEDDIDAGGTRPEIADPLIRPAVKDDGTPAIDEITGKPIYEGALAEAKRMVAEARKNIAPVEEAAPAEASVTSVEGDNAEEIKAQLEEQFAAINAEADQARAKIQEQPEVAPVEPTAPTTAVWASKDADYNVEILPDEPVTGPDGRMYQHVVYEGSKNYVPLDELRFEPVAQQETPDAGTGRPTASIDEGVGVSVPPSGGPEVVGAAPSGVSGVEPEAVGVGGLPPVPPSVSPDAEPSALGPVPKMKVQSDWRIKFADQLGQAELADNWAKSVLGTELPSELQTAPITERAMTMQAGQQRLLQRNKFDPLVDAIGNTKTNLGDFDWFLLLRGAADRNRMVAEVNPEFPEGGASVTTAEAQAGLQEIENEGLLPKYNLLAKKIDDLVDFNLEEDVKAGLISKEQAKEQRKKQPFYVPYKGFAADGDILTADIDEEAHSGQRREEAMRAMRAASPSGSLREYRQAFGRGSMPFSPTSNLMHDSEQRIRRRTLNKARLPILKQYKKNPTAFGGILNVYSSTNPKKVAVGGKTLGGTEYKPLDMEKEYYANRDKYMLVKDNGVPFYIEFNAGPEGQALRRMFMNMEPKDMEGAMQTVAEVNNFLKGMLTYKNPLYLTFVAPFRDMSSAIATAMYHQNLKGSPAYKKNLAARTAKFALPFTGTWSTIARFVFTGKPMDTKTGQELEEFIREGGATLNTRFLNVQEKAKVADQFIKKMQGVENLSAKERGATILEGLNKWVDGLADLMDMSARFATYRAAVDLGILPPDAARLALDSSLNLTRRGEKARNLDLIFPFFGAGVEAARKTKRIYTSKGGAKLLGALIVYGALESLWNAGHSEDDDGDGKEDYLNLDNSNMRMNRLTLYYGNGADDYVKVPIDPMVGYFKFVGNRIGDLMADTITPEDATAGLLTGAIGVMSPLRIPQADLPSAAVAFTPLIGKPIMENILNQNFFGSPIYKESQFDNAPGSELGRASTGEGWKWLARTVNDVTGGSEAVRGKIDLQPEIYRQMVEGYLGGPYQLAKQVVGLKDAEGATDIPGIKSFLGTGSEYAPQTQYFENSTVVRQITNRLNKLTPEQQMAQGAEFSMDTDPRIMDAYKAVDANLTRIGKEEKASLAQATNDEEKQIVLDYYRAQKNEYYSAFNFVYNAVKKE